MADEERLRKILARNLFYYVQKSGKTLQRIADDTGISKSAIGNYCSGVRYPRPAQLETLAKYFMVSVSDLTDDPQLRDSDRLSEASQRARMVAKMFDELDGYGKQIVEAVIEIEWARVKGGQK